jgi:hypothetical protein
MRQNRLILGFCRPIMRTTLPLLALILGACATPENSLTTARTTAAYGSWPSPISAASLSGGGD